MSTGDYLLGWVLFAAAVLPAAGLGLAVVTRRLGHLDRLEATVAGGLITVATFVAIHLVPLALGILSRGSVLVAAAAVALAAFRLPRRDAAPDPTPRPAEPASGRAAWGLGLLTAGLVAVAALAATRAWLSLRLIGIDTLTFHLPNVARWMQSGSLWQIDNFVLLQAQGYYPNTGDVVLLGTMLPWNSDVFVRLPMIALVILFAATVVATARELGAPRPLGVALAAAFCGLPIVGTATIPRAFPDALLLAGLGAGALFALRHARTRRTSDLVLCGLGLGLALGTKWYGLPAAGIGAIAVGAGSLLGRRGLAAALRDGAAVGGLSVLVGGIWLVRNTVESGNPLFPVKLAPFGVTVLDGPNDPYLELVGFSISDYLGDAGVLFGQLPGEIVQGLGLVPLVLALGAVVSTAIMVRRRAGRPLVLLVAALVLTVTYVKTPYSALGFAGDPSSADPNTRYWLPGLLCAGWLCAWAGGRSPRLAVVLQLGLLIAVVGALGDAFSPLGGASVVASAFALVAAAGAARLIVSGRVPQPALIAGTAVVAAAGVAYGAVMQQRIDDQRLTGAPIVAALTRASEPAGALDVAIAGDWDPTGVAPVWPSFGPRIGNRVELLARDEQGVLAKYERQADYTAALARSRPDLLVVGHGLVSVVGREVDEETWARAAGYRPVARDASLTIMVPSG